MLPVNMHLDSGPVNARVNYLRASVAIRSHQLFVVRVFDLGFEITRQCMFTCTRGTEQARLVNDMHLITA